MKYHRNEELKDDFDNMQKRAPNHIQVVSLGTSINAANLWSLRLSKGDPKDLRLAPSSNQ